MHHELKCWPIFFERIRANEKLFEVRVNDRGFQSGDQLSLLEYDPANGTYSGRQMGATVGYLMTPQVARGLQADYCVFALLNVFISDKIEPVPTQVKPSEEIPF